MKKITVTVCLKILILSLPLAAEEKIKFEGYASSGMEYYDDEVYASCYYQGKLKVETTLDENFKAVLDFRGRSETNEVELKGAYLRIKYSPWAHIKIGQIKKRFTLEEMSSEEDLPTIQVSLLNRHMDPFGFVVRGNGVSVYRDYEGDGVPVGYQAGVYYNESHHIYGVARFDRYSAGSFQRFGLGGVYRESIGSGDKSAMAFSLDGSWVFDRFSTEIESVWGQDPVESHYRQLQNRSDKAQFVGGRFLITYKYPVERRFLTAWEPMALFCFLAPDTDQCEVHQIQCLVGLNIYLHKKVRIRINGDLILCNNSLDTSKYTMSGSGVMAEVQTRW